MARERKSDSIRWKCVHCLRDLPNSKFNVSQSWLYNSGRLPICKECISNIYESIRFQMDDGRSAMQRLCMIVDVYWSNAIFDQVVKEGQENLAGRYIHATNSKQYQGLTFSDSIKEGFILHSIGDTQPKEKKRAIAVSADDVKKWGDGFSPSDYKIMNEHYRELKKANPNSDSNQEMIIRDMCIIRAQQMMCLRTGKIDEFNKLADSYRKFFQLAELKIAKDFSEEDTGLGVYIETIEKYTPSEYYKDQTLFEDVDKLRQYVERFMLRPLKNLMHGTKDRDYEFYIKDDGDDNG